MALENLPNLRRKQLRAGDDSETVTREVTELLTLDATALQQKWRALFGADSSPPLSRRFLIRALAYRIQEKSLPGLKPSTRRIVERLVDTGPRGNSKLSRKRLDAGTVLIRQWGGVNHRVTVHEDHVVYRGCRYRSLSEVARTITGTHWSGPLFFGLKARAEVKAHA